METARLEGLNGSMRAQLSGDPLFSCGLEARESLQVAIRLVELAMDETDAARGLMRAAAKYAESAGTLLRDWRDGTLDGPVATI